MNPVYQDLINCIKSIEKQRFLDGLLVNTEYALRKVEEDSRKGLGFERINEYNIETYFSLFNRCKVTQTMFFPKDQNLTSKLAEFEKRYHNSVEAFWSKQKEKEKKRKK